jgi:hypothetical protein
MGREVRRVPADWKHPRRGDGRYNPLFELGEPFEDLEREWWRNHSLWQAGEHPDQQKYNEARQCESYQDWHGEPPQINDYMPWWPEAEKTHYQMYETCSEGTPISPVMASPEKLARWLADHHASAFGSQTATYEQWLATIKRGSAPSALASGGVLVSGVEALSKIEQKKTP